MKRRTFITTTTATLLAGCMGSVSEKTTTTTEERGYEKPEFLGWHENHDDSINVKYDSWGTISPCRSVIWLQFPEEPQPRTRIEVHFYKDGEHVALREWNFVEFDEDNKRRLVFTECDLPDVTGFKLALYEF